MVRHCALLSIKNYGVFMWTLASGHPPYPLPSPVKQWSPSSFIHFGMLRDSNKLLCHTLPSISSHCCHCHLCDDAGYCVDTHYQVDVAITVSSDWHWWCGHYSMFNFWVATCVGDWPLAELCSRIGALSE